MSQSGGAAGSVDDPGTPVVGYSGNVANAAATATLPAVAGKTNYLTGAIISFDAPTAAIVANAAFSGMAVVFTVTVTAPASPAVPQPIVIYFSVPIAASAANTAINLTLSALGAGSANARVSVFGYVE